MQATIRNIGTALIQAWNNLTTPPPVRYAPDLQRLRGDRLRDVLTFITRDHKAQKQGLTVIVVNTLADATLIEELVQAGGMFSVTRVLSRPTIAGLQPWLDQPANRRCLIAVASTLAQGISLRTNQDVRMYAACCLPQPTVTQLANRWIKQGQVHALVDQYLPVSGGDKRRPVTE